MASEKKERKSLIETVAASPTEDLKTSTSLAVLSSSVLEITSGATPEASLVPITQPIVLIPEVVEPEQSDLDSLKNEILRHKANAELSFYEMGRLLLEVKKVLAHGEFLKWVRENIQFDKRTAQLYMQLAEEYSDANAISHLGFTKAKMLLALPKSEREDFIEKLHDINGNEKSVYEMSTRTLGRLVCEIKDGEKQTPAPVKKKNKTDHAKFYENVDHVQECIYSLLNYLENVKGTEEYQDLFIDLYNSYNSIMERLSESKDVNKGL